MSALRTLVFPAPDIKLPPLESLPFGAQLSVDRTEEALRGDGIGGFMPAHASRAARTRKRDDFVAVAERFLGTPYLWGGKTCLGIDCSGLVQVALNACGIHCPRDTYMQETRLRHAIAVRRI